MGLISVLTLSAQSNVVLPSLFSNHMVLQRDLEIPVWGWADKGEKITIMLNGQKATTKANKQGKWKATLPPMEAGGPYTLTINGENKITIFDVMIGEVWICSGQSNMEWPLSKTKNAKEEMNNAFHNNIRLLKVFRNKQFEPVDTLLSTKWAICDSNSARNFSAAGYFFGLNLQKNLNVTIGLIEAAWGGTKVEPWISMKSIKTLGKFDEKLEEMKDFDAEKIKKKKEEQFNALMDHFGRNAVGLKDGKAVWAQPELDESKWKTMELPSLWEDRGVNGVNGVVWFRKTIELAGEVAKNDVMLHLGAIDDSDITWVNGHKVGETYDKYDQKRKYKIKSNILKKGKNTIAIRVEDYRGGGGLWSDPQDLRIEKGNYVLNLAGTWKYRISGTDLEFEPMKTDSPNSYPSLLFNGMINPLIPYCIRGAIWYQGESNTGNPLEYRNHFPLMIKDWRNNWGQGDFPFLFVQLANIKQPDTVPTSSNWALLRESQLITLKETPNTGMAVTIDIGEADDIHPRNKQDVGYRLALNARKIAYGQDIVYSGPIYKNVVKKGNKLIISFDHAETGLKIDNKYGYLMGFAIAGEDEQYHYAKAHLDNNRVVVYSEKVNNPVYVRYAWADNPNQANLYNKKGLPASPFQAKINE